jgi:hypothetical protein
MYFTEDSRQIVHNGQSAALEAGGEASAGPAVLPLLHIYESGSCSSLRCLMSSIKFNLFLAWLFPSSMVLYSSSMYGGCDGVPEFSVHQFPVLYGVSVFHLLQFLRYSGVPVLCVLFFSYIYGDFHGVPGFPTVHFHAWWLYWCSCISNT